MRGRSTARCSNFYPRPPRGGRPSWEGWKKRPRAYFYPRPPRGGRQDSRILRIDASVFLSTPSARRATRSYHTLGGNGTDFYPRPPRGGRLGCPEGQEERTIFLSTPSARRATVSTRSLAIHPLISIHALREEGDKSSGATSSSSSNFYPRPPRGGRLHIWWRRRDLVHFYPRPPRGGRPTCHRSSRLRAHFYPRPPRGGRLRVSRVRARERNISIHALREEGDTELPILSSKWIKISIHALREEGDVPASSSLIAYTYFYPRPPRGGRPSRLPKTYTEYIFLSTPSARRATRSRLFFDYVRVLFLSTPSARRATSSRPLLIPNNKFLSTPSARRATPSPYFSKKHPHTISIHALREEGDKDRAAKCASHYISIHALREEGDVVSADPVHRARDFYPRPPRGGRRPAVERTTAPPTFLSTPSARRATLR